MNPAVYATATFALVIHWAVGIACAVVIADTEVGWIRDHPAHGRRLSGRMVPQMAIAGLAAPFVLDVPQRLLPPPWVLLSILSMLPFAGLSWRWSRTWIYRSPAAKRREMGVEAVAAGLVGLIVSDVLAMHSLEPAWRGVIPMAFFTAGVALTGSLTHFSMMALTAGLPAEVPGGKAERAAEMAAAGLLMNLLVLPDVVPAWLQSGKTWPALAATLATGWWVFAFVVPGCILLVRLRWRTMPDSLFMPLALLSALSGQLMAALLIFGFPGLIPPVSW